MRSRQKQYWAILLLISLKQHSPIVDIFFQNTLLNGDYTINYTFQNDVWVVFLKYNRMRTTTVCRLFVFTLEKLLSPQQ